MQTLENSSGKMLSLLYLAFLFIVLSAPITYKFTHKLMQKLFKISKISKNGCPTLSGLLLHSTVFLLLVRFSMTIKEGMDPPPAGTGTVTEDATTNLRSFTGSDGTTDASLSHTHRIDFNQLFKDVMDAWEKQKAEKEKRRAEEASKAA